MVENLLTPLHDSDQRAAKARGLIVDSNVLIASGNRKAAEAGYRRALAIYEELAAADPDDAQWQHYLAAATKAFRASYDIIQTPVDADPDNAERQRYLAVSHEAIDNLFAGDGDPVGA